MLHRNGVYLCPNCFKQHAVVAKKRILLAYVLAKASWQFYNSDWMNVGWTTDTVHFFYERRVDDDVEDPGVLDRCPYLFALPTINRQCPWTSAEYLPTEPVVHRYPRLLALGILLLKLGQQRLRYPAGPERCGNERECATVEERISTDLNDIRSTLRRKTWPRLDVQDEVRQTLRSILDHCSNPRLFDVEETAGVQEAGTLTVEERRAIIYRRIVHPLQLLLDKLGWVDSSGNIRSQDDTDAAVTRHPDFIAQFNQATVDAQVASNPR